MIDLKTVARGAFGRFLPTCVLLMGVGLVPFMASRVEGMSPWAPVVLLLWSISASLGYAAVLAALRNRLSDDAPVAARPSIVAGFVAPVTIMLALLGPPVSRPVGALLCALAGGALALGMFFPWLSRHRTGPLAGATTGAVLPAGEVRLGDLRSESRTFVQSAVRDDDVSSTA